MLQINDLRENKEAAIESLKRRNFAAVHLIDSAIELDDKRKKIQFDLDNNLAEQNKIAKAVGECYKTGKKEEAEMLKSETIALKEVSKEWQSNLGEIELQITDLLNQIPNIPNQKVPAGMSEEDNEVIFTVKDIPELPEDCLPHWDLAKKYDLIDFDLGSKVTGAGFPFYIDQGASLQRALVNYFLDFNKKAGYKEYQPPFVVNAASAYGTGQLPDKEGQMYHIANDDLYLIPTSEVPITNIFRDVILEENQLPKKLTAYSPCFRREAGSYGAHVRGLNRLHQFEKVEIVRIEKQEDSHKVLQEMVKHVEQLLISLGLPYRILLLCGGDLGFTSCITYDFEVYSAAQKKWLEVSSVSNFEAFQANRLKLRYKASGEKKTQLCHTLNGSSLALPRILAALLENNQTKDGIMMPKVLHKYLGFEKII